MSVMRRARAAPAVFALVAAALTLTWGATAASGLVASDSDTGPARLVSTLRAGLPDASLGETRSERRSDRHGELKQLALLTVLVVGAAFGWRRVLAERDSARGTDAAGSTVLGRAPPRAALAVLFST